MQRVFTSLFSTLSLAILSCLIPVTAKAQVTPDGTTATTVNQDGNNYTVEQGDRVGDNLFHSFNEFSVPTGGSAGFNNAGNIANIFSRVTGGNISNIDGLLSANGTANLYLINPNGIIFGENARLNLGGSFFASTADSLLFEGNAEFSAVNPQAEPLLEVNIPIGLSFRDNPGDIVNSPGSFLSVDSGKTLALIGGNVSFDGAIAVGSPMGSGNTIEIGGLTQAGIVNFQENGRLDFPNNVTRGDVSLTNSSALNVASRGDGTAIINAKNFNLATDSLISNGVLLDADTSTARSGDIVIDASEDVVIDGANDTNVATSIFNNVIDTTGGTTTATGATGNIEISARNISLINGSSIGSSVFNSNQIQDTANLNRNSNIILTAQEDILIESSNSFSETDIFSQIIVGDGDGETIDITAQNLIVGEGAIVRSLIALDAEGNAGNINLTVDNLDVSNGGTISSTAETDPTDETVLDNNLSLRNGGNINISANTISIDGDESTISSSTSTGAISQLIDDLAQGDAGDITIATNSLSITNGARLEAVSESLGDGGDIQITARDSISVDGGTDKTQTFLQNNTGAFFNDSGLGNAGNINITTPKLSVSNNGLISATTFNQGNAGNLTINASEFVTVESDAQIVADVLFGATGTGGNLTIETASLNVTTGGQISASTLSAGDAGNLTINATDAINIIGAENTFVSGLFVVAFNEDGRGGELNISTQDLNITNGAKINVGNFPSSTSSQSPGTGEPGNINIQASSIAINDGGSIDAATQSSIGNGANISIASEDITLDDNALISARAFEDADGGNLSIDSGFILAFPNGNSDIVARAERGDGGRISIDTEAIFGLEERLSEPTNFTNDIDASSEFGLQGDFTLNTPDFDPTTGLLELPQAVGDASDQISQNPCQQGVGSEFIVTGKGGLPRNPADSLNSNEIQVGLVEPLSRQGEGETRRQGDKKTRGQKKDIVSEAIPAMGWVFNNKGEVTLTAYSNTDTEKRRSEAMPSVLSQQHHTNCQSNISP